MSARPLRSVGGEDSDEKQQAEQCPGLLGAADWVWESQMLWLSENDIPERHFIKGNKGMDLGGRKVGGVGV